MQVGFPVERVAVSGARGLVRTGMTERRDLQEGQEFVSSLDSFSDQRRDFGVLEVPAID